MRRAFAICSLSLLTLLNQMAVAAPDEVQVYTDEMIAPGKGGVELHSNYSISGLHTPTYAGQMPPQHVTQITPEFFYGLTPKLEAGLYVPLAWDAQGTSYVNGLRMRLKYLSSHDVENAMFWGVNGELGYAPTRTSPTTGVAELRPIIGYRAPDWLVSFNPVLNLSADSNGSRVPRFEPSLKLSRNVTHNISSGLEYFGEYGAINALNSFAQSNHSLYGVVDVERAGYDLNFGLGRGYVNASDRWVIKAVTTIPFD